MLVFVSLRHRFLPTLPVPGKNPGIRRHQLDVTLHRLSSTTPHCGDGPPIDVLAWRRCRLLEAGVPATLAEALAADPRVDLHALFGLLDRGCPPHLAARILAPLPVGPDA